MTPLRPAATDGASTRSGRVPVTPELIGMQRCYQAWFRDPSHPDGTGVGLSDALSVVYGP